MSNCVHRSNTKLISILSSAFLLLCCLCSMALFSLTFGLIGLQHLRLYLAKKRLTFSTMQYHNVPETHSQFNRLKLKRKNFPSERWSFFGLRLDLGIIYVWGACRRPIASQSCIIVVHSCRNSAIVCWRILAMDRCLQRALLVAGTRQYSQQSKMFQQHCLLERQKRSKKSK